MEKYNINLINKSKVNPILLKNVSVLKTGNTNNVIVSSNNFDATKQLFSKSNLQFSSYPFANCFCVGINLKDLIELSQEKSINYIDPCVKVFAEQKQQDSINLAKLTENRFYGNGQTICFIDTGIYPHIDFIFPKCRLVKFIDLVNHQNQSYDDYSDENIVVGFSTVDQHL